MSVSQEKEQRGKRKAANCILVIWVGVSVLVLLGILRGSLGELELEALVLFYKIITLFTGTTALGLYGLDATGMQIIPAMKGGK